MKAHEILSIPLGEKVYVTELYHDRSSDLVAVGLKNSVLIYQLNFDNEKPTSNMIKAVIIFLKTCVVLNIIVHLYSLQISHDSTIHCLAWSPETTMAVAPRKLKFATGASDYCVRVFSTDLGQNETLRVLKGHRDYVNAVAFHPQNDGGQIGMVSHFFQ